MSENILFYSINFILLKMKN